MHDLSNFFDLSKAYYLLYYKILLSKLDACGIRVYSKSESYAWFAGN